MSLPNPVQQVIQLLTTATSSPDMTSSSSGSQGPSVGEESWLGVGLEMLIVLAVVACCVFRAFGVPRCNSNPQPSSHPHPSMFSRSSNNDYHSLDQSGTLGDSKGLPAPSTTATSLNVV